MSKMSKRVLDHRSEQLDHLNPLYYLSRGAPSREEAKRLADEKRAELNARRAQLVPDGVVHR